MDTKKKIRKHVPTSSSSSSSDDDDSSSSSSSSSETHRKLKHRSSRKQRDSSSSSEAEVVRKSHRHQHKKSSVRKHSHSAKMKAKLMQANAKKAASPTATSSRHKHHLKTKLVKKSKLEDHLRRSRTPTRREIKKDRTPEHRIASSPTTRIRVSVPNNRAIQERSRLLKDSPSSRRHVRETIDDRDRGALMREKEREKLRRLQEEEQQQQHYKFMSKSGERSSRRISPEKHLHHHHERSRSQSHGRIPIRDRLDKDYEYRRSISREHDDYGMLRGAEPLERSYRPDDRRIAKHDYGQPPSSSSSSARMYEDRHSHKMPSSWESSRDPEPRSSSRLYESTSGVNRSWDSSISHERKRIPDDGPPPPSYKERQWSDSPMPHDKWSKDKDLPEWKRGPSWKDSQSTPPMAPTMPHPRRWPGPSQMQDKWSPRGIAPHPSHKLDSHPSSGPPFKPRGAPYFGFKQRFSYKRFPNQYSKINFPSKHVIPSATSTMSPNSGGNADNSKLDENTESSSLKSASNEQQQQSDNLGNESGEIVTEADEDKSIQPDTTFSGNADANYQEECEGNLSEFSDVDDEILNREEARATAESNQHANSDQNEAQMEEQVQDPSEQKMISKIHANKELKKEMDLDFEEISDGELEQESAVKGLGDALGVDWASLASLQRPISRSAEEFYNATKSRWSAHRILWDVGVSAKYAGEEFARKTLIEARDELRREKQEWRLKKKEEAKLLEKPPLNGDVKKEIMEEPLDVIEIKEEPLEVEEESCDKKIITKDNESNDIEDPVDDQEDFELDTDVLAHPIAQVQVLMRKLAIKRKNLILNSNGKHGRALSARKDLKLRRQLCNLPTKDLLIDRTCVTNADIVKRVDDMYRQLVNGVN